MKTQTYRLVKTYRLPYRRVILQTNLTEEEAQEAVKKRKPTKNTLVFYEKE